MDNAAVSKIPISRVFGFTAELIKRIRKLRWIGIDEEANLLLVKLELSGIVPADSVIASPRETD